MADKPENMQLYYKGLIDKYGEESANVIMESLHPEYFSNGDNSVSFSNGTNSLGKTPNNGTNSLGKTPNTDTGFKRTLKNGSKGLYDFHNTADEFLHKITKLKALGRIGRQALNSLPVVGGIATTLMGGNVEASVPILEDIDSLNQTKEGSVDDMIENPGRYPEEERFKKLKGLYGKGKENE